MRKVLSLVLAICIVLSFMSFAVSADYYYDWDWDYDNWYHESTNRIEITFRVGDSILNINGYPIEVETPFVAGEGVTLVPLRVITEAFGAQVEWLYETQQIILTYLNVEIVLQINNTYVYVNQQRQTLLYQPVLTNNVTMIPLRFITENFGADVMWNYYTQEITVVKELFDDSIFDIEDVLRRSTMPMAGDSFFGWSIRRTGEMEMGFRSFDGRRNTFHLDGWQATIQVQIIDNVNDESFTIIQARELENGRRFTLIGHGIGWTQSGAEFIYTHYRSPSSTFERRAFLRGEHIVLVILETRWIAPIEREEHTTVLNTFDFVFNADETEDLSDVVDGMRPVEIYEFNIEFRVPVEWWDFGSWNRMNLFEFDYMDNYGVITGYLSLEVFSKQDGDSIYAWANEYLRRGVRLFNPELNTFSDIGNTQIGGVHAVYYQVDFPLWGYDFIGRRLFWEYEGYMYTLYIEVIAENEMIIQAIIDSFSFEAIDPLEIGFMLRLSVDYDHNLPVTTFTNTFAGFSIDVPIRWSQWGGWFTDSRTGVEFQITRHSDIFTLDDAIEHFNEVLEGLEVEVVREFAPIPSGYLSSDMLSGYMTEVKVTLDMGLGSLYVIEYVINTDERAFCIMVVISEMYSNEFNRENIERIVRSFVSN